MSEPNPYQTPKSLQGPHPDAQPRHRSFRLTLDPNLANTSFRIGSLREALKFAAIQQCVWIPLMSLVMDRGELFRTAMFASLLFWILVLAMLVRRKQLVDQEVLCIKWGYFPVFLITANIGIIGGIVNKIAGLL